MTEQHPITPPQELVYKWRIAPEYASDTEKLTMVSMTTRRLQEIADQAAQYGADQELEACVKWIEDCGYHPSVPEDLRNHRRPKPLSLKKQALVVLDDLRSIDATHYNILRNALEQLND